MRAVCPLTLSVALTLTVPAIANGEPDPGSRTLSGLIADVAEANQRLEDIGAKVQAEQESVNKAIVEVQAARDDVDVAQQEVTASQQGVKDANAAISSAQKRFDTFAASTYVNGPSAALVLARTPDEIISTATASQTLALSSEQAMTGLRRARTEVVNKDASARLARQKAEEAAQEAQSSQDAAVEALRNAQTNFREQQAEIDRLAAERRVAQQKLEEARAWSAPAKPPAPAPAPENGDRAPIEEAPVVQASAPTGPASGDRWDSASAGSAPGTVAVPYGKPSEWDLTLPAVPSAFLSGDPVQIINAILKIAMNSYQVTQQLGKQFLTKMGIIKPTDTGITNGQIPYANGSTAVEYVIKRAMAQIGVPYSWGGGTAAGASYGIDEGSGTVGFDCSGLILYAFAGVGIKLPHYSGSQYQMGRQIPSSQMRRGDVIFYGPGGSQHVALYLGNGQMLEAPYTGANVRIAPVRTGGMTPFVVRYVEY